MRDKEAPRSIQGFELEQMKGWGYHQLKLENLWAEKIGRRAVHFGRVEFEMSFQLPRRSVKRLQRDLGWRRVSTNHLP